MAKALIKRLKGIALGAGFTLAKGDKITRDEGARLAKLDVSTRLKVLSSKRVRVVKPIK